MDPAINGVVLDPQPGIARRETFLERWTAHGLAAAINADPDTRAEIAPRIHPDGRLEGDRFYLRDHRTNRSLSRRESVALLARCDGRTPAHSLGVDLQTLASLASQNVLRWEMEVPALDPYAFATLVEDVERWRDGPVRSRWLERLQPIAALPRRFAATTDVLDTRRPDRRSYRATWRDRRGENRDPLPLFGD